MDRIGSEVERTLARSGSGEGLVLAQVTAAWPSAVGEAIARQAWPLRIARDGTLHVATASATWAFELDRMSSDISERLEAVLGGSAPSKLRFRPGPIPEPGSKLEEESSEKSAEAPEPPPEVVAAATAAASVIEDEKLRELVSRAARASLSRARSGRGFW